MFTFFKFDITFVTRRNKHKGFEGNEKADELAKNATDHYYYQIPDRDSYKKAFTNTVQLITAQENGKDRSYFQNY